MLKVEWLYTRLGKVIVDTGALCIALAAAYLIRFDGRIPPDYLAQGLTVGPYIILLTIATLGAVGAYNRVWRYTNLRDAVLLLAGFVAPVTLFVALRLTLPDTLVSLRVPLSVIATYFAVGFLLAAGVRGSWRLVYERRRGSRTLFSPARRRLLIVGAGDSGIHLARDLAHRDDAKVVGFLDDDVRKLRATMVGVRVRGSVADLARAVVAYRADEVIVACKLPERRFRELVQVCEAIPVRFRVLSPADEELARHVTGRLREVRIEDLLARPVRPFVPTAPPLVETYRGRRVLVTGAGGSIGSEMCRKLLPLQPEALLLLDHDENNLFEIYSDLIHLGYPRERMIQLLADVRQARRLERIFEAHRPEVVLHAAAFKHVPFLEAHPLEAVENNVLATATLVDLSARFGTRSFVLISTDKAVRPTSVMGATKRAAELVVRQAAGRALRVSCVRFGNVLESRGSVVPTFRRQIARGGPVTVTHPDATRYFMTIAEACQLVLQAGSLGRLGEVFVLDMGAPVRIADLARDLIHLSGLRVQQDIEIQYVGLRPGERLHEQLNDAGTALVPSIFEGILVAPTAHETPDEVRQMRRELEEAIAVGDAAMAMHLLSSAPIRLASPSPDEHRIPVSVVAGV